MPPSPAFSGMLCTARVATQSHVRLLFPGRSPDHQEEEAEQKHDLVPGQSMWSGGGEVKMGTCGKALSAAFCQAPWPAPASSGRPRPKWYWSTSVSNPNPTNIHLPGLKYGILFGA